MPRGKGKKSAEERFWEKVEMIPESTCWYWVGAKAKCGYGIFQNDKKFFYAHRFSYQMAHGKIPKGLLVLHRCDVPLCVRESHLFLGTNKENTMDMLKKKRHASFRINACPLGHPYPPAAPGLRRICLECHRIKGRKRYAASRGNKYAGGFPNE